MAAEGSEQVMQHYLQGNFHLAINTLETNFYNLSTVNKIILGNTYTKLEQKNNAKRIFASISTRDIETVKSKDQFQFLLLFAEILLKLGKHKKFKNLLDELSKKKDKISINNDLAKVEGQIEGLYGDYFLENSDYEKAEFHYSKAVKVLEDQKMSFLSNEINTKFGKMLVNIGKITKAYERFEKVLKISEKQRNFYHQGVALNYLGVIEGIQGNMDNALSYLNKSVKNHEKIKNEIGIARVLNNMGIVFRYKGQYSKALSTYEKSIKIAQKYNNEEILIYCYNNIGLIKKNSGDYEEALAYFRSVLPILDTTENKKTLSSVYNNIGLVHKNLGELKQAEYYLNKALEIEREFGNKRELGILLNNIGMINYIQGDYEHALEICNEALQLLKGSEFVGELGSLYLNLGLIYQKLSDYSRSQQYYLESYKIRKELKNELDIAEVLYQLILNDLQFDYDERAKKHLAELKKIAKKSDNNIVNSRVKLAEAAILQKSSDFDKKTEASELLEDVLSNELLDFELKIFAMINLCEYLILEFKYTRSNFIFQQLEETVTNLYNLAVENVSHELIAEVLLIQSKLALVEYDTKGALQYIDQAKEIAESHNIEPLKLKISYIEGHFTNRLYGLAEEEDLLDIVDSLQIEEYIQNLYYQKEITNILLDDINKIRKLNLNLANILKLDENMHKKMRGYAQLVELSSRELHITHSTLLLIEQIEKNDLEPHYEDLNLIEFIEERLDLFKLRIESSRLHIDLTFDHEIIIKSDRFIVGRILDNLILNSIKFTDKDGFVKIQIVQNNNNNIVLVIDNECNSLEKKVLDRIFEKYFQYSPDGMIRGFGIGLTFVKSAIKLLRGDIDIQSPIPFMNIGVRTKIRIPTKP